MNREYNNPIAKNGDFADPFVLRYNGIYYLYATNYDIRCFSSRDLVSWKLEGPVIEPGTFGDLVPFAPEVVYHDGKFYMYTSPSGFGHYVLESDSPTGPFRKISENVGHAIDGTVFIDDDGTWYFYWAGEEGIWGCEMTSPTGFLEPVLTGADLHGWTEGPLICKRDGIYYMTYTGNHYLSKGYRIQAAWSKNPLTGYQDDLYNPVIIHTKGEGVGLGHSSTVPGPNLVSHYIVYHNLNEDATRDLNIDRILWHGETTQVLGPTRMAQRAPGLPDAAFPAIEAEKELSWKFEKGSWEENDGIFQSSQNGFLVKSMVKMQKNFTAELHIRIPQGNKNCGIMMESESGEVFSLEFSADNQTMSLYRNRMEEKVLLKESSLMRCSICDVLHKIGIQKNNGKIKISFDSRNILETEISAGLTNIGYFSEQMSVGVGYTAITNTVYEEEAQHAEIPAGCSFLPIYGSGTADFDEMGRVMLREGQKKEYKIRIDRDGLYKLYVSIYQPGGSRFRVWPDKNEAFECSGGLRLQNCEFWMKQGIHDLTIEGSVGETALQRLELVRVDYDVTEAGKEEISLSPYGKVLFDDMEGDDYALEADFVVKAFGEQGRAGILARVTEPSEGGEGGDTVLGINFFRGYSISVDGKKLQIAKHCYDRKILGETDFPVEKNRECKFSLMIKDSTISVFTDGIETDRHGKIEVLKVTDENPLVRGCAGIWAENSEIHMIKMAYRKISKEK